MPFNDTFRHRLHILARNLCGETHEQSTRANTVNHFPGDARLFNWCGQVEPEFKEQFKENVLLFAIRLEVLG